MCVFLVLFILRKYLFSCIVSRTHIACQSEQYAYIHYENANAKIVLFLSILARFETRLTRCLRVSHVGQQLCSISEISFPLESSDIMLKQRRRQNIGDRYFTTRRTLWCAIFVSVCLLLVVNPILPVSVRRFIPRQHREIRRWAFESTELCVQLKSEERYALLEENLVVKVISLKRVKERQIQTAYSLQEQAVPYEVFAAIDGLTGFPEGALKRYAGIKRQKRLLKLSTKSCEEARELYGSIANISDESMRESIHESLRFGCFMSHVLLWQELLESQIPQLVVLEDDVTVASNFSRRLRAVLQSLPVTWDLLYLNGCFKKMGPDFAPGVRISRGSLCTFGYVISSGAVKKLSGALERSNKPIDHILDEEILRGKLIAFHAVPPLVEVIPNLESTLAYRVKRT
jgi:GR25 family glycosyltransferase involved in LPS biosynthesis